MDGGRLAGAGTATAMGWFAAAAGAESAVLWCLWRFQWSGSPIAQSAVTLAAQVAIMFAVLKTFAREHTGPGLRVPMPPFGWPMRVMAVMVAELVLFLWAVRLAGPLISAVLAQMWPCWLVAMLRWAPARGPIPGLRSGWTRRAMLPLAAAGIAAVLASRADGAGMPFPVWSAQTAAGAALGLACGAATAAGIAANIAIATNPRHWPRSLRHLDPGDLRHRMTVAVLTVMIARTFGVLWLAALSWRQIFAAASGELASAAVIGAVVYTGGFFLIRAANFSRGGRRDMNLIMCFAPALTSLWFLASGRPSPHLLLFAAGLTLMTAANAIATRTGTTGQPPPRLSHMRSDGSP